MATKIRLLRLLNPRLLINAYAKFLKELISAVLMTLPYFIIKQNPWNYVWRKVFFGVIFVTFAFFFETKNNFSYCKILKNIYFK